MTPEELAQRHPLLYHVTVPGAWDSIKRHGLLSTSCLLDLFDVKGSKRLDIETKRRPHPVILEHPLHGSVSINDNTPLNEQALAKCLDANLTPADWLRLLNARVFFWSSEDGLNRLLSARLNRNRTKEVLVVDTLSLAKAHASRIELCPINSGVTFRKAARRGPTTFTPLLQYSFHEWSKLRGGRDTIREVTVLGNVKDIEQHLVEVRQVT